MQSQLVQILYEQFGVSSAVAVAFAGSLASALIALANYFANRRLLNRRSQAQKDLLEQQAERQRDMIKLELERDHEKRTALMLETEHAERQIVYEYTADLIARLDHVSLLRIWKPDELVGHAKEEYETAKRYLSKQEVNPAFPQQNWGHWNTFLIFQLVAAFNIVSAARWNRKLSDKQKQFLRVYDDRLVPVICSGSYPGTPLLYREQLEIVSEEMLVRSKQSGILRPMHWAEFCDRLSKEHHFSDLAEICANRFRSLIDGNPYVGQLFQTRLCMMTLYLIEIMRSDEARGRHSYAEHEKALKKSIAHAFRAARRRNSNTNWYVFDRGDVERWLPLIEKETPQEERQVD